MTYQFLFSNDVINLICTSLLFGNAHTQVKKHFLPGHLAENIGLFWFTSNLVSIH